MLGAEAIAAQHPHDAPQVLKRSLTPLVHAGSLAAWRAFKEAYQAFVAAYCVARNRLRAGAKDVVFPDGSFPSPMPFVRAAPA